MLNITIPVTENFDETKNMFVYSEVTTLTLEHSLASLSKWESKWEIPFLGDEVKTSEQTIDYIKAMTLSPDVDPEIYNYLTDENIKQVSDYIAAKMTATWFAEAKRTPGVKEVVTSELIYYWMVALTIPFECETWHLARLLTLIKVCNQKNAPKKKMAPGDLAARNRKLNEERKAKLQTNG